MLSELKYLKKGVTMKKFLVVLLLLTLAVAGFAGGEGEKAGGEMKIGVAISNFDDTFLMYMKDGMEEFAATVPGLKVTYVDGKEDSAKQLAQVENFITQGMDAIVVVPVDTAATRPLTDACIAAKTTLVYVNRKPSYLPDGAYYIGSQEIDAGIFQATYVAEKLNNKGNIVIMMGKLDNEGAIKRTEGVHQIADKHAGLKIIKEQTGNWSRAEGMTLMENWLASGDQIDAVCANNDDMALGAIKAIEAAGLLGKIIVGGVDATPDALAEMDAGKLDVTVFQDAAGQGGGSIETAVKLIKGESVKQEVWIPFKLVTPDNYKEFMK
jgi:inositol transport system substrate-binding protein